MTASWPSDIPKQPLQGQWGYTPQSNKVSFQPEIGPSIDRRRGTSAGKNWTATFSMSRAQVSIFEAFFETTLASGVLPFNMNHPLLCVPAKFKFDKEQPYSVQEVTMSRFNVSMKLVEFG